MPDERIESRRLQIGRQRRVSRLGLLEYNQFNLSCDLMEPFRPIVDRVVFDNIEGDFTKEDKRLLVDMLSRPIPYREGSYRVASVISLYVKDCLDALARKLSVDEIEPFDVI